MKKETAVNIVPRNTLNIILNPLKQSRKKNMACGFSFLRKQRCKHILVNWAPEDMGKT